MSAPTLGQRILRETTRFAALQVVSAVMFWVSTIALSRMLTRRDFGVFAIGITYIGFGTLLGDGGLGATLLRRRDEPAPEEYQATLSFLLWLGVGLALTFFVASPWIASASQLSPTDVPALRALTPLFLVGPLRAVPYIRMERGLRMGQIARIELTSSVLQQVTALVLAWRHLGVWALVLAQLTGATCQLVFAWYEAPGWPGTAVSWSTLRSLLAYGVKVQGLALAAYFKDKLSVALLGMLLGPQSVGLFDFAVRYAQVPVLAVNALGRVQLPVYARLEKRDPALRDALVGATRAALVLGVPFLVVMAVAAPTIIAKVNGAQWLPAVPVVWGLTLNMAGGLLAGPMFTLLQGQGFAGLAIRVFTVWTAATWLLVLCVWPLGLPAVAWAYSASTALVVLWLVRWASRHLGVSLWRAYVTPVLAGASALAVAYAMRHASPPLGCAALALASYAGVVGVAEGARLRDELRAWRGAFRKG